MGSNAFHCDDSDTLDGEFLKRLDGFLHERKHVGFLTENGASSSTQDFRFEVYKDSFLFRLFCLLNGHFCKNGPKLGETIQPHTQDFSLRLHEFHTQKIDILNFI